jgi:GNAT superfamily N-acetyltransferase
MVNALLRPATLEDATALAPLCGELGYPASAGQLAQRLAALLSQPASHLLLVAEQDGQLCGWVHGYIRPLLESDPALEIGGLVVAERVRGQGIGALLLTAAENWAHQQGVVRVTLRSHEMRVEAHRFYQRQGYHVAKRQLCLRKALAP